MIPILSGKDLYIFDLMKRVFQTKEILLYKITKITEHAVYHKQKNCSTFNLHVTSQVTPHTQYLSFLSNIRNYKERKTFF